MVLRTKQVAVLDVNNYKIKIVKETTVNSVTVPVSHSKISFPVEF